MKKIIIYGLGEGRGYIEACLKADHQIIGYTDSNSKISVFNGRRFYPLEELKESGVDYIILAMENRKTCQEISAVLNSKYGIDENRVIDFWHFYYATLSVNLADYRVLEMKENIDGVILGLSHGEVGIHTDYLTGEWCNLAISSQDIYSNCKVFRYVYEKYTEKFTALKYVIFDLFDWIYFNYDTSMAGNALHYIGSVKNIPGIIHNLKKNKQLLDRGFTEEGLPAKGIRPLKEDITEQERSVMTLLFENIHAKEWIYRKYGKRKKYGIIEKECDDYCKPDYMPAIGKKHFYDTIQENILAFRELLNMLYQINGEMKIYAVLIPRYYIVESIHKNLYRQWKEEFEDIIEEIRKDYRFEYLNFKDYLPISGNHYFYSDVSHLNETGSAAFTSLLDSMIFQK